MTRTLTLIATVAVTAGCTTAVNVQNDFDVRAAQAQMEAGNGSVAGTAFMLKRNGDVVTCAGNEVYLVPATDYAKERFSRMYPGMPTTTATSLKHVDEIMFRRQVFFPDPPAYYLATKATICDENGNFAFHDIKDGDYFVNTSVYWEDDINHGGTMARRVIVENGVAPQVTLTPLL
ncbi:MAG TPA: hypothetical protein VK062_05995 [Burkholderiaceae bacterium]|nr:hypothetical protein [Burkholderiaceae bacterium]